jgi:histidyl-tRNA synthetase
MLDVEVILVARDLLTAAVVENYKIRINSIGCARDKKELGAILRRDLKEKLPRLCPECKKRYSLNALRILDCKNEECRKEIGRLDIKDAYLCVECRDHFKKVLRGLDELGVNYELSDKLVRGLDYYTGTVFEITHASLGAQDALGAGGRYNNLLKELGGPELGAVGFALGVERVLLARGAKSAPKSPELVYLITLTDMAKAQGLKVLESLRGNGIYSDTDYEAKSLKGALRKANDLNARLCLIIGEDELKNNTVTLKDMASGQQNQISADDAASQIGKILNTGERC